MDKPPKYLNGALVLEYVIFDDEVKRTSMVLLDAGPGDPKPVKSLAIAKSLDNERRGVLYLFNCADDWEIDRMQAWNWPGGGPKADSPDVLKIHAQKLWSGLEGKWILADEDRSNGATSQEPEIPSILAALYGQKRWPRFIRNRRLKKLSPYITDENFELFQSVHEVRGSNNIATLDLFYDLVKDDKGALRWKLTSGEDSEHSFDPAWLNLDFALVIGGGTDYGDDKWVCVDLRFNRDDPRVVYNWYQHQDADTKDSSSKYDITWHELAPSISTLANAIEQAPKPWWQFW